MKKRESFCGHSTVDALRILHDDIQSVLLEHERALKNRSPWSEGGWLRDAFHHGSRHSSLCCTSALALIVAGVVLIVAACVHEDSRFNAALAQGMLVIIIVGLNAATVAWDSWLRHSEISKRVQELLHHVRECIVKCTWRSDNYPQLCSPYSPCITLQWTMRDGQLVNLPWALLVRGDLVEMRPGQQAPGHCVPAQACDDAMELRAREVYSPRQAGEEEEVTTPKARKPLRSKQYILQETPYLSNLREAFDKALARPVSYHNKLRHLLSVAMQVMLCVILSLVMITAVLRWGYLSPWLGYAHWSEMLLLQPVTVCLPLLPLVFPVTWTALNCYGMARIQALFHTHGSQVALDPFEECSEDQNQPYVSWRELWPQFLGFLRGHSALPCRSANLLHVLGSVTALCCVDKKGILSWPNPTAEKVFFLRSSGPASCTSSMESMKEQSCKEEGEVSQSDVQETSEVQPNTSQDGGSTRTPQTQTEVLDLTHDHASPFRLQFDDPGWRKHLSSLKPLGLSILLNTCNMATQENYTQFCSHVTCEAMHSEHLVPVTNRRQPSLLSEMAVLPGTNKCLCELAKQIGFQEHAQEVFHLEQQLSTFRHVQAELVRRDIKFARSLSLAKLKFPFPHMVAVVVREKHSGALQLLSQGTADIILDSCDEFWDGRDLCPLAPEDRRKVQDFYQRTSLTAYCTAFAYRPLSTSPALNLSNMYLELPADSKHLYAQHAMRSSFSLDNVSLQSQPCRKNSQDSGTFPTQSCRDSCSLPSHAHRKSSHDSGSFPGQIRRKTSHDSVSVHSQPRRKNSRDSVSSKPISPNNVEVICDVEGCFELQCNQVFVGMVTMQYQAQTDMVQLIEQLERACIRFVHFSKENELRSRVFSEKMGLESGWNCHISLLSERTGSENSSPGGWISPNPLEPPSCAAPRDSSHTSLPRYAPTPPRKRHESAIEETESLIRERPLGEETKNMSFSAPSAINLDFSQVKFEQDDAINRACDWSERKDSKDSVLVQSVDLTNKDPEDACRSLSVLTDSTEQSAPVNFDMSNRAKLPRGIDKIRPHLEHIDNVPLLVSLFTDCTPAATREMLAIMQEYGEVVCAMGSSANADNMPIFMQADASMAVEPLYPQVCQRVPVFTHVTRGQGPSPVELSRSLNSVACSVGFLREDPISIFHLIMECRHYMLCVTNCVQFWLSSSVAVALIQLLAMLVLLPPLLTTGQVLWLQCVVIPLLSVSLVGVPTDAQIMQSATGKNHCTITTEASMFVLWFYGSKFLPAAVTLLGLYAASLASLCPLLPDVEACSVVYPSAAGKGRGWGDHVTSLSALQHAACLLLVIYLVVISVSFVHRHAAIWSASPAHNKLWLLAVLLVLVLQLCFSALILLPDASPKESPGLSSIPWLVYMLAGASPFLVFLINELVKQQEIKASVRQQKKARLEFGTKLGMNSPF